MSVPLHWDSLTRKKTWPELELLFENEPNLIEAFADGWVRDEERAISNVAQALWKGRRGFRSSASLNMKMLADVAMRDGFPRVAEALRLASFRVW